MYGILQGMSILGDHLASNAVCVLPTEAARRSHLIEYALTSEDGVIAGDSVLSFDTFRSSFLPAYADRLPSNTLIRFIFATEFVESGNSISSFYNPDFPESKHQALGVIASMLPSLLKVLTSEIGTLLPRELFRQLQAVHAAYTEFLNRNNLFEPQYDSVSVPSGWNTEREVRILYSDLESEAAVLYEELGRPSWLKLIPTPKADTPTVDVYANHLQEIRSTLRRIRDLLDEGVATHEIMICLAGSDELLATLEDEAYFYGIPLAVRQGRSPLKYPAGRFFSLMNEVHSDRFTLTSLKKLLLEPAIPWKAEERKHIEEFIRLCLKDTILYGSEARPDYFELRLSNRSLRRWYVTFRDALTAIVQATTVADLVRSLSFFRKRFWEEEEWHGTPQEEVFAHAMKQIEKLDQALKACNRERLDGLYALFLSHLQRTQYVPQQQDEGIGVYRWPQGASITGPYRFFLGLDQEGAEVVDNPFPFLSERVRQTLMKRKELGRYHLQAASLGNSTLSCHRRSNNGEKLIHFFFLEEGTVHPHEESLLLDKDPQSGELNRVLKKEGDQKPTYLQRLSFGYAEIGSLRRRRWENDHTRSPINEHLRGLPYEEDGRLKLSATKIDAFAKCPYIYLASYLYKIEPFDYRETLINNKAIGVLLHDAYERFFSSIGPFDSGKIESYEIGLQTAFDHALLKTYGTKGPTASIRQWIIHTFRPKILKILEEEKKYFEHLGTTDTEKELAWKGDRVILDGRIDRIIGIDPKKKEWGVIDFKKGKAFDPVKYKNDEQVEHVEFYQLLVYQALIERNDIGKAMVAAYYSVEDGKYKFLYEQKDAKKQELCRIELDRMLERILSEVQRGDYAATPGDKACKQCSFRALCRRRYSTQ